MSSGAELDSVEAARANFPAIEKGIVGEKRLEAIASASSQSDDVLVGPNGEQYPTKEELETLPHVVGKVNWIIYSIAFVELCERFGYYGTTAVCEYIVPRIVWYLQDKKVANILYESRQFHPMAAP